MNVTNQTGVINMNKMKNLTAAVIASGILMGPAFSQAYETNCGELCGVFYGLGLFPPFGTTTAPTITTIRIIGLLRETFSDLKGILTEDELKTIQTASPEASEILTKVAKHEPSADLKPSDNFKKAQAILAHHLEGKSINGQLVSNINEAQTAALIVAMNMDDSQTAEDRAEGQ